MSDRILIAGANAAGQAAASELRGSGFDGDIALIGDEPTPAYERPVLSKEYLRGTQDIDRAFLRPADWYEEQGIDARFGRRVTSIDTAGREATLDGGEKVAWDRLLLATGIRNRILDVPGSEARGIHCLRNLADADAIRADAVQDNASQDDAARDRRAVVVGMGFIGAEVAASLRTLGVEVTVIEPLGTALERVLGPDFGRVIEGLHAEHGVSLRFGEGVSGFEAGSDGRVAAVVTDGGDSLPCDFTVIGVGTLPNTELAEAAGISCDNGILVDAGLRTSAVDVWAAGDVANHDHPLFGRMRAEHFDNAIKMGATAARNMLGADEIFDDPHWFWSDQYDCSIQMAGFAPGFAPTNDELVVRGDIAARDFTAFYLIGGVLRQVLGINRPRDVRRSLPLIRDQIALDPAALADDAIDLRTLVGRT